METRNIAIMLTDIKGFTSKTAGYSRAQTQELLTKHRELVLPVIEKFHGRLVKTIGDAFLVAFDSPTDAVICGVKVQEALKDYNSDKAGGEKIEIRIAINSGEVAIHDDGDIYGDPVNITSRLESIAEAGEVFFTEAVYLAMNKREVPSSEIGYRQFKGVPEKIKVFRVLREVPVGALGKEPLPAEEAGATAPRPSAPDSTPVKAAPKNAGVKRRLAALLLDVVIFLMITGTLGLRSCSPSASVSTSENKETPMANMSIDKLKIDSEGIKIEGKNGESVSIGKGGTVVRSPDGKVWKKKDEVKVGFARDPKKVPLGMLLWVAYTALLMWRLGGTFGMKILKLRAVDAATGLPLAADKAFVRALFSLVSLFCLLGYIWAAWERNRCTWHDLIAGTRITDA